MQFTKVEPSKIDGFDIVKVIQSGNVIEIVKAPRNKSIKIKRLYIKREDDRFLYLTDEKTGDVSDFYMVLSTGEIKKINHIENRKDNTREIKASLNRLRNYINANCTDATRLRWCTLTYKENMKDTKRLYEDANKFIKRLRYRYGSFEYIMACEPQKRGAWHIHMILIFPDIAPFIANKELREIWRQGFVRINEVNNIDNLGAYLSAYLGDLELDDKLSEDEFIYNAFKSDFKVIRDANGKISKRIVKGARLSLYPPNFNLYRISKGIIKPTVYETKYYKIKKELIDLTPTHKSSTLIEDDNFKTTITREYYNIKRR